VSARELDAAERATGFRDTRRYPRGHLDGVRHWQPCADGGARWFGFEAVRDLRGLPPEILIVSLPGHTAGHCGVAVRDGEGWLLHAGDTYFFRREMDGAVPSRPPATGAYEYAMAADYELFLRNQARLREVYRGSDGLAVFCTHDPVEFEALSRINVDALLARPTSGPGRSAPTGSAGTAARV
jgi:glyoxylase-like metal-dependent hydrolase (beta-lactamase superfamily II)